MTCIAFFYYEAVNAQNLAVNGNFETFTQLPNYYAQSCYATGWKSPSGSCNLVVGQGSPDYYHINGSSGAKPPSTWWANVMPHTGNAMQGFCGYYTSSGSFREYVQYQLSAPMVPGVTYQVSYWLTNGNTTFHGYGCNHIGAYFSTTAVTQTGGSPMPYVPQVEDPNIFFSNTWQLKSFTFTATAAFAYVTIGNFYTNANTSITQFVFPSTVVGAYYYIDDVVIQAVTPLPVTLLSFTAENKNKANHLSWSTASEINNDYYEVQRSRDGDSFELIGTVTGNGNSSQVNDYYFVDPNYSPGINYYRLKQVDYDGNFKFSQVVAVNAVQHNLQFWYSEGTIHVINYGNQPATLIIRDISGRTIQQSIVPESTNNFSITDISKGMYFVSLCNGEETSGQKILIY